MTSQKRDKAVKLRLILTTSHFSDRRKSIALRFHAPRKPWVTNPWLPVERMRSTPGGYGRNFLRFCPRRFGSCLAAVEPTHPCVGVHCMHPAAPRKPVICRIAMQWADGRSVYQWRVSPVFSVIVNETDYWSIQCFSILLA